MIPDRYSIVFFAINTCQFSQPENGPLLTPGERGGEKPGRGGGRFPAQPGCFLCSWPGSPCPAVTVAALATWLHTRPPFPDTHGPFHSGQAPPPPSLRPGCVPRLLTSAVHISARGPRSAAPLPGSLLGSLCWGDLAFPQAPCSGLLEEAALPSSRCVQGWPSQLRGQGPEPTLLSSGHWVPSGHSLHPSARYRRTRRWGEASRG